MSGFFGTISKSDCVTDLYYGVDYNSHLGTKRAGMVVINSEGFKRAIHNIERDYFRSKFESELPKLHGNAGIGIISDLQSQPIIVNSHLGRFAIAVVGKIINHDELVNRALKQHKHFAECSGNIVNQTELVSMLINEGATFKEGIENVYNMIKGSCSMLILTNKGIYAARDKLGRTPIIIGKKAGAYAATSETIAFPNLGYEIEYYVGPGEIVYLTAEGMEQVRKPGDKLQICAFLWVYYGYPASYYENINVDVCRYRCGAALARNDDVEADLVCGVPDSGVGHGIGYSNERKLPYIRVFVKYTPTWPRSFMPQNQEMRDLVAKMKLVPNKHLIEGKRIIFCEDSIVRGTQLKDNTQKILDQGAKEVHLRVACPVLLFPCDFLNFSTSRSTLELAGRTAIYELEGQDDKNLNAYAIENSEHQKAMIEQIKKRLKLTNLKFQKLSDLIDAIGLPKEMLCTHCWDNSSFS